MNLDKKKILIMLLILSILLLIVINLLKIVEKNRDINDIKEDVYEEMMQEMVMPNGIFMLKKNYQGKNDLQDFYRSINELYRTMIKVSKMNDKSIEKYYDSDKENIKSFIGINDFEKFKKFVSYAKSQGNLKSLMSANIDTESFKNQGNFLEFNMNLVFDQNREFLFKVNLSNQKTSKNLVKYEILTEK